MRARIMAIARHVFSPRTLVVFALALAITALIAMGLLVLPLLANAAPVLGGGGYDYWEGPGGQVTRSALGIVGAEFAGTGSASLTAVRFDDSIVGEGLGAIAGVGVPIAPRAVLRAWGARYVGDESWRAWRVKTGPQVELSGGATLGLYYAHYGDNADSRSDGAIGEVSAPLAHGLTARGEASVASAPGDLRATQGALGLAWAPLHGLEISGEVGLARNGAVFATPGSPGRPPLVPVIGVGTPATPGTTETVSRTESTAQLGIRVLFP